MKLIRLLEVRSSLTLLMVLMLLAVGFLSAECSNGGKSSKQVTDQAGRTVDLPGKIKTIVSLWPEATRVIYALGAQDMLVGVDTDSKTCPILSMAFSHVKGLVDLGSPMKGTLSIESLAGMNPDIVFMRTEDTELADKIQHSLGIPVICVRLHPKLSNEYSFDLFSIIGKCIGKDKKGRELQDYLEQQMSRITSITLRIPDSEKPKVYQAFGQDLLKTIGSIDVLDLAGGKNVAKDGGGRAVWYSVNLEDILHWDPDIVILHGFGKFTPKDINSYQGWKWIKAVKKGKVFKLTLGWTGWDPAGLVINVIQNAKVFHPDRFSKLNVEEEANVIFNKIYKVRGLYSKLKKKYGLSL